MKRKTPEEAALIREWEKKLRALKLSMDAGRDPGHRKLIRVGGASDLERIQAAQTTDTGKVSPSGSGSDSDE